jgi:L-ascorbate metabolism protein UlaG (beta-lactamase superfamily)
MKSRLESTVTAFVAGLAGLVWLTAAQAVDLQWFGHAAFKITSDNGKVIVIDPFITKNPKTPENLKDLSKIGKVDLILVTHGHGDHMRDVGALAEMTGAKVALNADMGHTFGTLGIVPYDQLIRFNKSGAIKPVDGITVTMVHAEHSSGVLHIDPQSKNKRVFSGGEPAGYIVELENGLKIYHAGDTGVFTDMRLIGALYDPDVSLLPIGGHFTMDPVHAAYAVNNLLKSKTVIPIHFGTYPVLKGTPEQFKQALGATSAKLVVMEPGETRKF